EDLGIRHRLWVYSGRRGVHCWVCDDAVRKWSPALRAATVEYLTLVKVGMGVWEPPDPSEGSWGKVLALVPEDILPGAVWVLEGGSAPWHGGAVGSVQLGMSLDQPAQHREGLQGEFLKKKDSVQRWELLRGRMERTRSRGATPCYADWEIMLQFCFPRLDINVSKGVGHLLKSPFSVHPKTGRISVPLDLQRLDQFDPFAVPTITWGEDGPGGGGPHFPQPIYSLPNPPDYRKTSLAPYVRVFEQFVEGMESARRGERLRRS
ncbi:PRI1 primase, partial [Campylorhamphus procurvoides]|nr:PRI1 primase [Campylorhamphus procurvoides]